MSRGRVMKIREGDVVVIDRMVVRCKSGKAEIYVYGEGEIITPNYTREFPCDTKESVDALWRVIVDKPNLQGDDGVRSDDLPDRGRDNAASGMA